jgi:hypothetical protein
MNKSLTRIFLAVIAVGIFLAGCSNPAKPPASEEPVVIEQGSTVQPDIASDPSHDPDLAPIFPGAQKLPRSADSDDQRESYITRAPYALVEQYYTEFFKYGEAQPAEIPATTYNVNTIFSRDTDGRRQTALWVNPDDGPNGGLKVLLKEYETQSAVQIILTDLAETPPGISPVGMYLTPEEMDAYLDDYNRQQAEIEAQRQETESNAIEPPVAGDTSDDSGNGSTSSDESEGVE